MLDLTFHLLSRLSLDALSLFCFTDSRQSLLIYIFAVFALRLLSLTYIHMTALLLAVRIN